MLLVINYHDRDCDPGEYFPKCQTEAKAQRACLFYAIRASIILVFHQGSAI